MMKHIDRPDMVKLQVPIAREVRDELEKKAYELGFDSIQAFIRVWAKAEIDGRVINPAASNGQKNISSEPKKDFNSKSTSAPEPLNPEVRFYFNPQLHVSVSQPIDKLLNPKETKLKSPGFYEDLTMQYAEAWQISGDKRLTAIRELLGLEFNKPVLEVTVVPFVRPNNRPLLINDRSQPDRAIDVITHEIIHELLEDNTQYRLTQEWHHSALTGVLMGLFGDLPPNTLHHIAVHAVLKYLFLDVLDEEFRLEWDIAESQQNLFGEYYIEAWNYLKTSDYRTVLDKLHEGLTTLHLG